MTAAEGFRVSEQQLPFSLGSFMQSEYSGWMPEQMSWKEDCYIGDWTFVPQLRVKGPDALRLFSDLSVNSLEKFPVGRAKHCIQCNEDGKVITEGILLRHGDDDFEYEAGNLKWLMFKADVGGYDVSFEYPHTHKLQVAGPKALAVLEKLTKTDLRDVKFMHSTYGELGNEDVMFLRQGMAGEIGFELHGPIENRDAVWAAVLEAGQEFGIRQLGSRTLLINHLEACYPTSAVHFFTALDDERRADYRKWVLEKNWDQFKGTAMELWYVNCSLSFKGSWDGDDIEGLYKSPVELGWGRNIKFDHDFIGREALEKEVAEPRRAVVTLEFNPDDMMRIYGSLFTDGDTYQQFEIPSSPYSTVWTDWILKDGKKVGHATYPGYSLYFRKAMALSFIDVEYSQPGTEVTVLWGSPGEPQTEIRAIVAPAPYLETVGKVDRRRDLKKTA